jgi:hypothetical protein
MQQKDNEIVGIRKFMEAKITNSIKDYEIRLDNASERYKKNE